jgi:hypothetical protein
LDLAHAHAACVHRNDPVIEVREPPLAFGNEHRIEGAFAVAWNLQIERVVVGGDALAADAVAVVRAALPVLSLPLPYVCVA